jgi:hypothetical protein
MNSTAKILALLSLTTASAFAGLTTNNFTFTPVLSDGTVNAIPAVDNTNFTTAKVGLTTTNAYGRAGVFVFAMPKIPFGETISPAATTFSLRLITLSGTGFNFNGDLYSLGASQSSSIQSTDYYNGVYGGDSNPLALPLQQHFLTPSSTTTRITPSAAGQAAIAADLQSLYAQGATQGTFYFLRVNPDLTTLTNTNLAYNLSTTDDPNNAPVLKIGTSQPPQLGRVLIEYWSGIAGTNIASLQSDTANFTLQPSGREYATTMEIPQYLSAVLGSTTTDTNFGDRLRGVFYPTVSGNYTFAIASDDASQLSLSTDATPANAVVIASVTGNGATYYHQWNKYPTQTSAAIPLVAGQGYYIEAQHKQAGGAACMSIGYIPPSGGAMALMPATNVAPYDPGAKYTNSTAFKAVMSSAHPRLMLSEAALDRLAAQIKVTGSTQAAWWAQIQAVANTMMTAPVETITTTDFTNEARVVQDRAYYMGLDYLLSTDPTVKANCLNAIYAQLQATANWGGPGNNTAPGNWYAQGFLGCSEICHAYAIAYDWCYAGWTPAQRAFIVNTLSTQGLEVGVNAYNNHDYTIWNNVLGNQFMVATSCMAISAISVMGEETGTAYAPTMLDDVMPELNAASTPSGDVLYPDGGWSECEGYLNYPMRHVATLLASLETSAATCYQYDQLPGLSSTGAYELYTISPLTGAASTLFTYGDEDQPAVASAGSQTGCFQLYEGNSLSLSYFGLEFNQPVYSWRQQETLAQNIPVNPNVAPTYYSPSTPLSPSTPYPTDLIWFDSRVGTNLATSPVSPAALHLPPSTYFSNSNTIFLRSAWNDPNALYAGLKGGTNQVHGDSHFDLDIGDFVFDALGIRWAYGISRETNDYGLNGYFDLISTDPNYRYQYYRKRTEAKNTLVINPSDDGGQSETVSAKVTNFASTATTQQAIIDMTTAYNQTYGGVATPVTGAKRGMRFINGTAQLQDEVATNSASATVDLNWFMNTVTSISLDASHQVATLTSGTKCLQVQIQSPSSASFTVMAATSLSADINAIPYQNQDPNVSKLRIEYTIPSGSQSTTVTVAMCPYVSGSTPPTPPPVTPLATW